eukprot:4927642-Alexandrium_andersonii.AAC.1
MAATLGGAPAALAVPMASSQRPSRKAAAAAGVDCNHPWTSSEAAGCGGALAATLAAERRP